MTHMTTSQSQHLKRKAVIIRARANEYEQRAVTSKEYARVDMMLDRADDLEREAESIVIRSKNEELRQLRLSNPKLHEVLYA